MSGSWQYRSLRYQLPLCCVGVPRDIKIILWFRLWEKDCGINRSVLRNQDSIPGAGSFYLLRNQCGSEALLTCLRSSQPPDQRVPGSHISRAQTCQDTKLTTHCPAVLRLKMHGALPPLSIHVIIWYLTKSRCQLTCTVTTKPRYLMDASDVCGSHIYIVHAPVNSAFCMVESDVIYTFCAGC